MAEERAELDTKAPPATEGRERERCAGGREGGRDADGGGGYSRSSGRGGSRGGATQATIAEARLLSPTKQQALNSLAPTTGHRLSPVTMTPCLPTWKGRAGWRAGGGVCVRAASGKKSGTVHTVTGMLHVRFGDRFDRSVQSLGVRFGGGVLFTG
jgi:hypothetical protein